MDSQRQIEHAELALIYETAPVGLVLLSPELIFLRINHRLAEMNGIPAADHIGKPVAELLPDFATQAEAMRDQFLAGGGPVSKLFTGTTPAQPGVQRQWLEHWSPMRDAAGQLAAINIAVEEVTEQRKQEESAALLLGELRHRIKNTLAVVQSIARNTFSKLDDAEQPIRTFEARMGALAHAHDLLLANEWQRAEVGPLVHTALGSVNPARFTAEGPECYVSPDGAMSLTLGLHELCTNAVKYGALSGDAGMVRISWTEAGGKIHFAWEETGGPPCHPPAHRGFGLKLLGRVAGSSGEYGGLEFRPEGLVCRMSLDRDAAG